MQLAYSENFSVLNTKIVSFREKKFWSEVTATNGRNGFDESGTIIQEDRDWAFMQFEMEKNAF